MNLPLGPPRLPEPATLRWACGTAVDHINELLLGVLPATPAMLPLLRERLGSPPDLIVRHFPATRGGDVRLVYLEHETQPEVVAGLLTPSAGGSSGSIIDALLGAAAAKGVRTGLEAVWAPAVVDLLTDKVSVRLVGPQPCFRVRLQVRGRLSTVTDAPAAFDRGPAPFAPYETAMSAEVSRLVEAALAQTQSLGTDPFGFGAQVRIQEPALWRQLRQDWATRWFPWASFEVQVQTRIDAAGRTLRPLLDRTSG